MTFEALTLYAYIVGGLVLFASFLYLAWHQEFKGEKGQMKYRTAIYRSIEEVTVCIRSAGNQAFEAKLPGPVSISIVSPDKTGEEWVKRLPFVSHDDASPVPATTDQKLIKFPSSPHAET